MSILRGTDNFYESEDEQHAKEQGQKAGRAGRKFDANPYPYGSNLWDIWNEGYFHASPRRRPLDVEPNKTPLEDHDESAPKEIGECYACGRAIYDQTLGVQDFGLFLICSHCDD